MYSGNLGKAYRDGDIIVRQGEAGECLFVVQEGQVQVVQTLEGTEVPLGSLGAGEVFGEMALFERELRSATVRALGPVRVLTVDKRTFLQRVHEDPSLAFRILETMSRRIRALDLELARVKVRESRRPA